LLAVLGFSLTAPATRAAVPELGATFVGAARSLIAGCLALGVLAWKRERPPWAHWRALAAVGAGVVVGFPLTSAVALASVPATHATVVIGVVPVASAVYAVLRDRERGSLGFWCASAAGALAVALFGATRSGFRVESADLWLLAAVACAALGYTEGARLARTLGGWRVISWALLLCLPLSAVLGVVSYPERGLAHASRGALLGLGYVSIVSMYLAFFAWYRGLSLGSIARASQVQFLQPLLGLAWSNLLLNERVDEDTLLAGALVLGCAFLARRARVSGARHPAPDAPLCEATSGIDRRATVGGFGN
jgi:drug/metabolite transporter (DMT)-like permease